MLCFDLSIDMSTVTTNFSIAAKASRSKWHREYVVRQYKHEYAILGYISVRYRSIDLFMNKDVLNFKF